MISFFAQDTISTQKMKLLLFQVRRSQRGRSRTWWSQHWGSCRKTWYIIPSIVHLGLCIMFASIKPYKHQPLWSFRTLFTSPPPQSHSRTLCDGVYVCQKSWSTKVSTGIKVTKVEVTGWDTKEEDATEVFFTKDDTPWLETSK